MHHLDFFCRSYDLRGVVPDHIDADMFFRLGRACAQHFDFSRIAVGRDGRLSSPELHRSFVDGVRTQGKNVVDLGMVTSDMLYFSTLHYDDVDFGAMITASHNPKQYNGIKLCRNHAVPVSFKETGELLRDLVVKDNFSPPTR